LNRIDETAEMLRKKGEKAFIPFLVIGDPDPETFLRIVKSIEPNCDILELGIPYTDPIADGPTIQSANGRAFQSGMNFSKACDLIKKIRSMTDKPIVILTYANVIGVDRMEQTLSKLSEVGVDGIVVADIPLEESGEILSKMKNYNMDFIFLIAPTTISERLHKIAKIAQGFLYLVAVKGVTGSRTDVQEETVQTIKRVKVELGNDFGIPFYVGFGISKPEHVKKILSLGSDGVIVGSAIIRKIEENLEDKDKMIEKIANFTFELKKATKTN
jgi:tryptophan synthase alpha chain